MNNMIVHVYTSVHVFVSLCGFYICMSVYALLGLRLLLGNLEVVVTVEDRFRTVMTDHRMQLPD